jgi:hypothetical protein
VNARPLTTEDKEWLKHVIDLIVERRVAGLPYRIEHLEKSVEQLRACASKVPPPPRKAQAREWKLMLSTHPDGEPHRQDRNCNVVGATACVPIKVREVLEDPRG